MNRTAVLFCMGMMLSGVDAAAEEKAAPTRIELKDGSTLEIGVDGTNRMFDHHGKRMSMEDGVEMETADGRVILMMNKKVWYLFGGSPSAGKTGEFRSRVE